MSRKNYEITSTVQTQNNRIRALTTGARILKSRNLQIMLLETRIQQPPMKDRRMMLDGSEPALVARLHHDCGIRMIRMEVLLDSDLLTTLDEMQVSLDLS